MKLLEKLQERLEQLTAEKPVPLEERVADAKQAHLDHLDVLHLEEQYNEVLDTIARTVRLEALRIKQYVDRKEVYKLAGRTYPLHPHDNIETIQSFAQKLEDESVTYGVNNGMTADEVRSLVRDVWEQIINSRLSTGPLQSLVAANKPYTPLDQKPTFNPSEDALRWLELAKTEYHHRVDWEWDPARAKELFEKFVETIKSQASRGMGVIWPDGAKRNKLGDPDLIWLERSIRQLNN